MFFYEKEGTFTSMISLTLATSSSVSGDFSTFRFSGFVGFLLLSRSGIVTRFYMLGLADSELASSSKEFLKYLPGSAASSTTKSNDDPVLF